MVAAFAGVSLVLTRFQLHNLEERVARVTSLELETVNSLFSDVRTFYLTQTLLMCVLVGLSWSVLRNVVAALVHPFEQVIEAKLALMAGDLSRRVDLTNSAPEFQRLGEAFNEMAASIQQAREEINATERRLRGLVEHASDGILLVNAESRLLDANPAACTMLGYSHDELVNLRAADIVAEQDLPRIKPEIERRLGGEITRREWRLKRKDGSILLIEAISQRIADGTLQTVINDVTQRKEVDERIRRLNEELERRVQERTSDLQQTLTKLSLSEASLRGYFDSVAVGAVQLSPQGQFLRVNDRYCAITGYKREELLAGMTPLDIVHPEDLNTDRERVAKFFAEGSNANYEVEKRIVTKGGIDRWVRVSASRVLDEAGVFVYTAAIVEDITERKLAEARLEVEQRRREELSAELAAREQAAFTGRMAATVAHEINNPLNGIRSSLLVVSRALEEDHVDRPFVALIEREVGRISTIVQRLLGLYHPTREEAREFSLSTLAQDVAKLTEHLGRTSNVQVRCVTPDEPCLAELPEASVSEVLYNLVKNAIEASPPGGMVELKLESNPAKAVFTVSDQGDGIPESMNSRIFEPFFTTKKGKQGWGLGLGLAATRSRVQAMHGRITFNSQPGKGTTFRATLPLKYPAEKIGIERNSHAQNTLRG